MAGRGGVGSGHRRGSLEPQKANGEEGGTGWGWAEKGRSGRGGAGRRTQTSSGLGIGWAGHCVAYKSRSKFAPFNCGA